MALHIVKYGSPILLAANQDYSIAEIKAPETQAFVDDMIETMNAARGVGLAAPQVGVNRNVCVIDTGDGDVKVLFNPVMVEQRGKRILEEGCLSIPGRHAKTKRSSFVWVEAVSRDAKPITFREENTFLAHVLEHEIDHLNGVLYVRKMVGSLKRDRLRN